MRCIDFGDLQVIGGLRGALCVVVWFIRPIQVPVSTFDPHNA